MRSLKNTFHGFFDTKEQFECMSLHLLNFMHLPLLFNDHEFKEFNSIVKVGIRI